MKAIRSFPWIRSFIAAAFLVVVIAAPAQPAPGGTAAETADLTMAVFPLDDLAPSPETRGLGEEISATLTDEFARSGKVRVVERKRLQQVLEELKLGASGLVDDRTAIRAGKLLGANALVLGSFLKFGESVKINIRIVHTETGEILTTERISGKFSRLLELEEKLAAGVLPRLRPRSP